MILHSPLCSDCFICNITLGQSKKHEKSSYVLEKNNQVCVTHIKHDDQLNNTFYAALEIMTNIQSNINTNGGRINSLFEYTDFNF